MQESLDDRQIFTNRTLVKLLIPLFFEQLLSITIGMADTMMVSSVGETAVSAVSLVDSINFLLIQVFSAMAAGGAVVAAQYIGRQDRKSANDAGRQLFFSTVSISLVIMALSLCFSRSALQMIFGGVEDAIMANAVTYFILSAVSYPFLAVYNTSAALMRSVGDSKTPLFISIAMNIINVVGNAITIFWWGWGVAGAAAASLLARAIGAGLALFLLSKPTARISLYPVYKVEFKWGMIQRILKIAVPNGLENSMFQIGKILVASLISSMGTAATAANAIGGTISGVANIPGGTIALCMVTVVGQCMGAGEPDQAAANTKKLMWLTHISMLIMNILVALMLDPMLQFFNLSEASIDIARQLMWLFLMTSFIFWPWAFGLPSALRAAGDAKVAMVISVLSMWIFRIGFSYLLCGVFKMGVIGVWIAMVIDWVVRGALYGWRFKKGEWRKLRVI